MTDPQDLLMTEPSTGMAPPNADEATSLTQARTDRPTKKTKEEKAAAFHSMEEGQQKLSAQKELSRSGAAPTKKIGDLSDIRKPLTPGVITKMATPDKDVKRMEQPNLVEVVARGRGFESGRLGPAPTGEAEAGVMTKPATAVFPAALPGPTAAEFCPFHATLVGGKIRIGPGVIIGGTSNYIFAGTSGADDVDPAGKNGDYHLLATITCDIELGDLDIGSMALYDDTEFAAAVNPLAAYRRIAYVSISSGVVTRIRQCCHSDLVVTVRYKTGGGPNFYSCTDVIVVDP